MLIDQENEQNSGTASNITTSTTSSTSSSPEITRSTTDIAKGLASMKSDLQILEGRVKEAEEKINETSDIQRDLDKKIEVSQIRLIETLGVIVAIFTFISVEFSIFKSDIAIENILGLTLVLLGSLIFLVLLVDVILRSLLEKIEFNSSFLLRIILLLIGIFLIGLGVFISQAEKKDGTKTPTATSSANSR